MDEQSITVTIADRPYKLTVKREDEEIFREATKYINDRLKSYAANFSFKDKQDLLAMVALQYTTNALKNERILAFQNKGLEEKLVNLNSLLDSNV
ncbi:MAG: cell division protein ZapA [Bacteroidales bacterium]|jgi:cell division protein ZapA|nr:cell division protein ZapA [Bacteroidales bacterium]